MVSAGAKLLVIEIANRLVALDDGNGLLTPKSGQGIGV
jgi:hypothetical protein